MRALFTALAVLVLLAGPTNASAAPGRTEFEILMNGKPVGRHSVSVTESGGLTRATVAIDMAGRVGPIGFTYSHDCEEVWRGAELQSLECRDQQNRTSKSVTARRSGNGVAVRGTGYTGAAPASILPSSWWRGESVRQSQFMDSRDGKILRMAATSMGEEAVATAGGPVRATRWRFRGAVNTYVWYDTQGRWVKSAFRLSGQNFVYRKLTPVNGAPAS